MKTFGEMTDEEQGALLLAHHRGEVIEIWDKHSEEWLVCEVPYWVHGCAYRVKKEPVVDVRVQDVTVTERHGYDFLGAIEIHQDVRATCTYTDGKLTKIHWEADQ